MQRENSIREFEKAGQVIPGGVNSPVRAFKGVGGSPVYIHSGQGAYITDIDGNRYLDFLGSWGPLILGHAPPAVVSAIKETCERGTSFGAPTMGETELAEKMIRMVPSLEMVRMVNSGTEATMSAIRLARGYTRRDRIVKFAGCYHGHGDSFLIAAGSGAATLGVPNSPGVTPGTAADTLVAPFNDLGAVEKLFQDYPDSIAAVIVEPVAGNMGVVPPAEGFLQGLRTLTEQKGALLILDEVMTGFRVARGGAQELYGIKPDLSTFGKIIGGGLPVGAYGGRRDIMAMVAPSGPVYQAGTLSGNPLAAAAGLAALNAIDEDTGFYDKLDRKAAHFAQGIEDNHEKLGIPGVLNRVGSMMTFFFTEQDRIGNYAEAAQCDAGAYGRFFHLALEEGLYFAPSAFEATFLSSAHTDQDIEAAIASHYRALKRLKS